MKSKSPSRPLSPSEGFSMISDYFRSGMSGSEYYRSRGISEWQFYKWCKLYLQDHPELIPPGSSKSPSSSREVPSFARLEIEEAPLSSSFSFPSLEIQYPNGTRLCIGEGLKEISCLLTSSTGHPNQKSLKMSGARIRCSSVSNIT